MAAGNSSARAGFARPWPKTALYEPRISRTAVWSRRLAWFSLVLFALAGLGHRRGMVETVGFLNVLGLVGVLAALAGILAVAGFVRAWTRGERGLKDAMVGALISAIVLAPFAVSAVNLFTHPWLNDISTDLVDPPSFFIAAGLRTPGMNRIRNISKADASKQLAAYPEVTGRRYGAAPDRVLRAVDAVIARDGWKITAKPLYLEGQREYTLEAVATTRLLAFRSDVAIRLTDEGETTYVDMRSASRYGRSDLGDNAARIDKFLNQLDDEMSAQDSR